MAHAITYEGAIPRSSRRAHWQAVLAEWRGSGLSQAEFCRRRGILPGTLAFWKHTLARAGGAAGRPQARPGRSASPIFVPVRVSARRPATAATARLGAPRSASGELAIMLRGDRHVRVRGRVDMQWLGQVVRMLEGLGC